MRNRGRLSTERWFKGQNSVCREHQARAAAWNSLSSTLRRCTSFPARRYIKRIKLCATVIRITQNKPSTGCGFGFGGSSAQLCKTSGAVCHLQPIAGYDVRSPKSQAAHIEFIEERAALDRNPQDGSAAANAQGARFNIQLATCILNPVITRFRIQAYCIHRINRVMRQGFECK